MFNKESDEKTLDLIFNTKRNHPPSARALLLQISCDLKSGNNLTKEVKEWLAEALGEIAQSDPPEADRNLGVAVGRGQTRVIAPSVDVEIARWIYYSGLPKTDREGGAYFEVTQRYDLVTPENARKIYKRHEKQWQEECSEIYKIAADMEAHGYQAIYDVPQF
tara:strand:- start:1754 stop:2242 length:489 start_codon:yes stop_codon:yes gene_type:complete